MRRLKQRKISVAHAAFSQIERSAENGKRNQQVHVTLRLKILRRCQNIFFSCSSALSSTFLFLFRYENSRPNERLTTRHSRKRNKRQQDEITTQNMNSTFNKMIFYEHENLSRFRFLNTTIVDILCCYFDAVCLECNWNLLTLRRFTYLFTRTF